MTAGVVDRYRGLAAWYDETAAGSAAWSETDLHRLVPEMGAGAVVLDLGCGTGLYTGILATRGDVVGVDLSEDQLGIARGRNPRVVAGDGARLPVRTGSVHGVAAIWVSTDVDDLAAVLAEARRVLRREGWLVLFGVHPCFNGPFVENREDGARIVHPGYRQATWHTDAPWWGAAGIRRRVSMRHVPLAALLNAVIDAGFDITRVEEPRDDPIPAVLAIVAAARR